MNQVWRGNECEKAHTLTTRTTGSKNSQKGVNAQTDYQSLNALAPQKVPSLQILGLGLSQVQDTLSNQQAQPKETETVNLIENDAKSLTRPFAWLL